MGHSSLKDSSPVPPKEDYKSIDEERQRRQVHRAIDKISGSSSMEEVNANLLPIDVFKQLFTRKERDIVCAIKRHADTVCRNFISEDYIRSAMNRFDRGYVYKSHDGHIVGFTVWKELSDPKKGADTVCKRYIYLLLICADQNEYKLGSRFLYDVEKYASTIGASYIELQPLNDRLRTYYTAHGYLSDPQRSTMLKPIVPYSIIAT